MYDGWLCDSTLNVIAQPSPMSTTPAFSPLPASIEARISSVVVSPKYLLCTLDDLYEQCSDHMTEYMASSASVGLRPRISRIRAYSSSLRPSSRYGCGTSGVAAACSTESTWVVAVMPAPPRERSGTWPARPRPARSAGRSRARDAA